MAVNVPGQDSARTYAQRPISVIELFTIGVGPSSSHTVGPMRAALDFAKSVVQRAIPGIVSSILSRKQLDLGGRLTVEFAVDDDLRFRRDIFLPAHPNALDLIATLADGSKIARRYYSIGGGAIVREGDAPSHNSAVTIPHPFESAAELLAIGAVEVISIAEIVRRSESAWRDPRETDAFLHDVRRAMSACIDRGIVQEGTLPGALKVKRRAAALHAALRARGPRTDPSHVFERVSLWALAVNEENAAGGRVVTAPTSGAAGVLPAVLRYYETFVHDANAAGALLFLYTASAVGFLYKKRASISAAEMGCQGEIGVACSMAAAGLTAALGGTNAQIEDAAEIGMEHNLGLTCDPIGGLVQIPCIERNTMGAIKAINAAYLALHGDGTHRVSLDAVIETMRQTGEDMRSKYKETSLGGLAVNVVEC